MLTEVRSHTPVIPTLESGKAETRRSPHVLEANLDYMVKSVSKRKGESKRREGEI